MLGITVVAIRRRIGIALLSLAMFALCASAARADDAKDSAQAGQSAAELKQQGDAAMTELRYADALKAYEAAHQLEPNPALSYNRGRALQALNRFPEALEQFEKFKRDAPPELKARVPKLGELMRSVRSRVATLKIRCNVSGARVLVDGRQVGVTPLGALQVNSGQSVVEVLADDHRPYKKRLALKGKSSRTLDVRLLRKGTSGILVVRSAVTGARVAVNGSTVGNVPAETVVPAGTHRVVVEREGYESASTEVVIAAGERRLVDVRLEESPGLLSRWWFWTGVGVVVVGGVTLTVALLTERDPDKGDIDPGQIRAPLLRF